MFDIVFISYQESNADKNWERLISRFPYAKRIHGIKGIHQAHIEAAKQCTTDMFWVVDGDAEIQDSFNFDYEPEHLDYVYVWRSLNPINGLIYGNGGVKLLPRLLTEKMDTNKPDMTTSISSKFKPVMELSNITAFNTDEFNTWKSAFRECCKLASKIIDRQKSDETEQRLDTWCTAGADKPFGDWAIKGAQAGRAYGEANRGNVEALKLINDFDWLKSNFESGEEVVKQPTSENRTGNLAWLHGLEEYFKFQNDEESKKYVDFLLHMVYADNPVVSLNDTAGMIEFIGTLRKYASNDVLNIFHKYYRSGSDPMALQDAFSRGQVLSKIWLVEELKKVQTDFDMVFLLAGWFGQLRLYFDTAGINYNKIRILDIDPVACKVSDQIFNIDLIKDYRVKSAEVDLNNMDWLFRTGCEYNLTNYNTGSLVKEKSNPSLIINTSAEHFHERWYHKFVNRPLDTDPLFVIQSNNLFAVKDHVNAISSMKEMHIKFPMSRIEYAGEIQLSGYKRYMLIGRP